MSVLHGNVASLAAFLFRYHEFLIVTATVAALFLDRRYTAVAVLALLISIVAGIATGIKQSNILSAVAPSSFQVQLSSFCT